MQDWIDQDCIQLHPLEEEHDIFFCQCQLSDEINNIMTGKGMYTKSPAVTTPNT